MRPNEAIVGGRGRGIEMRQSQRRTNPSTRKAPGQVAIKEQTRRREHTNSRMRRRAKKGQALGFKEAMSFGNESLGKPGNVGNRSQRIQIYKAMASGQSWKTTVWPWWMKNAWAATKFSDLTSAKGS